MYLDPNAVNPYIRTAIQSILPAGAEIRQRIILDYELIYIEHGECTLTYDGNDYPCRTGQFVLLRPGISHSFLKLPNDLSQPHIHFDIVYSSDSVKRYISFADLSDLPSEDVHLIHNDIFEEYPRIPYVRFSDKQKARTLFYNIVRGAKDLLLTRKAALIELIGMLIADNFPDCFLQEHKPYGIAQQIKDYIDAGQGLSSPLDHFEKLFSYSKFYLDQQFKKVYGISLIAYRNDKRLQIAKALLQTHSVSATAEQLGFSSIYAFSRAFKQHFRLSPSQYKKQLQVDI